MLCIETVSAACQWELTGFSPVKNDRVQWEFIVTRRTFFKSFNRTIGRSGSMGPYECVSWPSLIGNGSL